MRSKLYAFVVLLYVVIASVARADDGDLAGKVFSVDGSATVERAGSIIRLEEGMQLLGGDEVVTGEPGRIAVELPDGSYIRLASGSRMKLPKVEKKISLFEGALHFLSHTTKHPIVETQQVTAAIRGTEFTLVADKQQTTLSMFSGEVDGDSVNGKVRLGAGQGAHFRTGRAPETFAILASDRTVQWSMFVPFVPDGGESEIGKRAISLYSSGESKKALALLSEGANRSPCGPDGILRARLMLSGGDPVQGGKVLERCAGSRGSATTRAAASSALANVKLMQRDSAAADRLSAAALADNPSSHNARLTRSFVLQERGDLDGALALFEGATDSEGLARKAELLFMAGKVPEAREILETIPQRSWYAESVYGFVLMADRSFTAAEEAFNKAAALEPGAGLPRMGLGIIRVNRGDLAAARSEFERATVLEPTRALYRSYLGKAYFEDNTYRPAHPEYERAIELDPNDPTPYLYRSFMRVAENDLVGALDDIGKARELSGNRNVYRSQFLLDQDSAMQSASVGRVYEQLGFKERGRLEAITAITGDYQNATAHRLLSQTQESLFSADVVLSERRISNLFAPLSVNVVDAIGTNVSLNEYSQLFERDGWRTATNNYFDSQSTQVKSGVLSAYKNENVVLGLSADGAIQNGLADDPRASAGTFGLSLQGQPTWADRYLVEAKGVIDGSTDYSQSVDGLAGSASAAYLHKFSSQVTGLVQTSYSRDREVRHLPTVSDESFYSTIIANGIEDSKELAGIFDSRLRRYETSVNNEAQLIATNGSLKSILTYRHSYSGVDAFDKSAILEDAAGELDGLGANLRSSGGTNLNSQSASYLGDYSVMRSLHLQFGGEFESLQRAARDEAPFYDDTVRRNLWSPKAGMIYMPSEAIAARIGYGEGLGKASRTDLTSIEPTLIGGINQRYNDLVGTKAQNLGFGLDLHPEKDLFFGGEWNKRWLAESNTLAEYAYVRDYDLGQGYPQVAAGDTYDLGVKQDLASSYVYKVLSRNWVTGLDYRYVRQDAAGDVEAGTLTDDHRGKAFTRYFFAGGLFMQASATYRYQDRTNIPLSDGGSPNGSDNAWFMGAGVGYRLPTRHGLVLLDVQNIFGQDININQLTYFNEPVFNDPTIRLSVNFNF